LEPVKAAGRELKMKLFSSALLVAALIGFSGQASAMGPKGMWLDQEGKARIKVATCKADTLCAKIVWLRQPNDENGKPLNDANNGNVSLRDRPIIGLPVAYDMKQSGSNKWQGRVYDPQRGGPSYTGYMTLLDDGRMKVTGCLAFLCESKYWTPLAEQ
jgi:uncharacterized protein (DUF2147 family)